MFHELTKHRGGTITADLATRTLTFTPPAHGDQRDDQVA